MSDINQINYQPLQNMDKAWGIVFKQSFSGIYLLGWIAVVASVVGAGIAGNLDIAACSIIVWTIVLGLKVSNLRNTLWTSFANANGWTVISATSDTSILPPSLNYGHSHQFSPDIQANVSNIPVALCYYTTTTGEGKYQQSHPYTIARTAMAIALPHIALINKSHHAAKLENDFAADQKLQLEGDFDKYFDLKIEQGAQIDVLTILTPDVMQALISYAQAESIEAVGQDLYFICSGDHRDVSLTQQLLGSVVQVGTQIAENVSHSVAYQQAMATAPSAVTTAAPNVAAAATMPMLAGLATSAGTPETQFNQSSQVMPPDQIIGPTQAPTPTQPTVSAQSTQQ